MSTQYIRILVLLVIVLGAISFIQYDLSKSSLTKNVTKTNSPTLPPTLSITVTPTDEPFFIEPTNVPTSIPQNPPTNSYQYPGSSSEGNGRYTSSDDVNSITEWYVSLIRNNGMNTTSFVKTSSNGNVLNKLVGSGNSREISVTIQKNAGDSLTTITVE